VSSKNKIIAPNSSLFNVAINQMLGENPDRQAQNSCMVFSECFCPQKSKWQWD